MRPERRVSRTGLTALALYAVAIVLFAVWVPALRSTWSPARMASAYRFALLAAAAVAIGAGAMTLRR